MKRIMFSLIGLPLIGNTLAQLKPNIIINLADDLGYGDVSSYGSKTINTPNIYKLANNGILFNNGYATSATSTPSRYGLLTGMYPWKNSNAKILEGDAPLLIDTAQFTFPKMMKKAGYNTAAIGKWHLGMGNGKIDWNKAISPSVNDVGFDYSCVIAATVDRVPTVYIEDGRVIGLDPNDPIFVNYNNNFEGEPTAISNPEMLKMKWSHGHNNTIINGVPRIGYMKGGTKARWNDEDMACYFANKVDEYLEKQVNQPFFLYYGLHEPHVPRIPHNEFVGKSGMGPRGDAILEADWCIGELLENLEKKHLLENTIIIFSSDNGPVLDDGYKDNAVEMIGNHQPTGGLRGGKYSLFDAGTHVPFILYWKNKLQHHVSDALVTQLDIMSSIAGLLKLDIPTKLDGENIWKTFSGKQDRGRKEFVIEASGRLAYMCDNWVLIPPYKGTARNESGNELGNLSDFELFNLKQERAQITNLATSNSKRFVKMKKAFLNKTKGYYNPNVRQEQLK
ncbi:MAG: sulfatase-like hydrolase/transferase [Dysgonomonas sp.]